MIHTLRSLILDEFVHFSLPKTLTLHNSRLGMLYRLLQLLVLAVIASYCIETEVGFVRHDVKPWNVAIFARKSQPAVSTTISEGTMPSHCTNPQAYKHQNHDGHVFLPSYCEFLLGGDAFAIDGNKLLFHTFVEDTIVWDEFGDACATQVVPWCAENETNGSYQVHGSFNNACSCTIFNEFLVENPEQQQIILFHGFEVDLSNGNGESIQRRAIAHDMGEDGGMQTIFEREDGLRCHIGGKELWSNTDAQHGISTTLKELLACAGIDLDAPRHHRTMGLSLDLRLAYQQKLAGDLVCRIKVVPTPFHARAPRLIDLVKLPNSGIARRVRSAHGIALTTSVSGQVYSYDWAEAVKGFVAAAVLMQVPQVIVGFVALYCMGLISEIHRRARRTRLNLFALLHSAAAKFMLAEVAFRGLIGGVWHGKATTLKAMTKPMLFNRLKEIFSEHILDGTLQDDELKRMSAVIFSGMDRNKNGLVSCNEFIHILTDDGELDLRKMARMFDDDGLDQPTTASTATSAGAIVGNLLDSTHQQRMTMAASVSVESWEQEHQSSINERNAELAPVDAAPYSEGQNDDLRERMAALEKEGRCMKERIAALESSNLASAAISTSDVGVHEASSSHVQPQPIDIDSIGQHCWMSMLAQMMGTLRRELTKELDHMEERFGALEKVLQVKRNQQPVTNHPQHPEAPPGIHHRASPGDLRNASLGQEGFLQLPSLSSATSLRPQQPVIAGPVQPALSTPSPRLALHSAAQGLAESC